MQKQVKNIPKICDFEVFANQKIAKSNSIKIQRKRALKRTTLKTQIANNHIVSY